MGDSAPWKDAAVNDAVRFMENELLDSSQDFHLGVLIVRDFGRDETRVSAVGRLSTPVKVANKGIMPIVFPGLVARAQDVLPVLSKLVKKVSSGGKFLLQLVPGICKLTGSIAVPQVLAIDRKLIALIDGNGEVVTIDVDSRREITRVKIPVIPHGISGFDEQTARATMPGPGLVSFSVDIHPTSKETRLDPFSSVLTECDPSKILAGTSGLGCRKCESKLSRNQIKRVHGMPSASWAELSDFWTCGHEGVPCATLEGKAADGIITGRQGTIWVGSTTVLVHGGDVELDGISLSKPKPVIQTAKQIGRAHV